jgi:hypothetical protein
MIVNRFLRPSLFGALAFVVLAVAAQVADAGILRNAQLNRDPLNRAVAAVVTPVSLTNSADPSCCAPVPPPVAPCCPVPCITYRHLFRPIVCCGCPAPGPVKTVLTVKNPCTCACCDVAIPVCLPGCCTGEPKVSCHHGLFACGVVQYDWCCGVSVVIKFKRSGEVIVTYHHA